MINNNKTTAAVTQSQTDIHWCTATFADVLRELESRKEGLTLNEAEKRLEQYGPNRVSSAKPDTLIKLIMRQLTSPLLYILILAAVIAFFIGEFIDAGIIGFVVFFNVAVGAFQEGRAQNALFALKKLTTTDVLVMRSGASILIPSEELVPGDIVLLRAGDRIVADMRVVVAQGLVVDEAVLTGESLPVAKQANIVQKDDITIADQVNMLWNGTHVVSGAGTAVVVATGARTEIGRLSQTMTMVDTEVPLAASVRRLSRVVLIGVIAVIVLLFAIGLFLGVGTHDMVRTAVSLFVSVIPEGLPVVMTLILATGVKRMSQNSVLVKRLQAVEALGQAKVIAVDKTGTLTKNELVVREVYVEGKDYIVTGVGYDPNGEIQQAGEFVDVQQHETLSLMARLAGLSANADLFEQEEGGYKISGDPTEAALRVFGAKFGFDQKSERAKTPLIAEIPFDHTRKYYVSVFNDIEALTMVQTGAGEVILDDCTMIHTSKGVKKFSEKEKQAYRDYLQGMSDRGLRVIGIAYKNDASEHPRHSDVEEMTFIGFFGMKDALRAEVPESLMKAKEAGMHVVMITGDHVTTAVSIARDAGIFQDGDIALSGPEMEGLSIEEIASKLDKVSVFARVTPEHKMKIVQAYQHRGQIIAMTGDGVNDAPSLVAAHLGVAMGKVGTEVAKEAADIVLLDDDFGHIPEAVAEGRHIYRSIQKVLIYLFSTNLSELIVIVLAVLLLMPLPLTPAQIIWLNVVTDTFLVIALALEPKEKNLLQQAFGKPSPWLLKRHDLLRMLMIALVMAAGTLGVFLYELPIAGYAVATSMALITMVSFQLWRAWSVRTRETLFKKSAFRNKHLVYISLIVLGLQVFVVYVPFMQKILGTTELTLKQWVVALGISLSVIVVDEIHKAGFRIKKKKGLIV